MRSFQLAGIAAALLLAGCGGNTPAPEPPGGGQAGAEKTGPVFKDATELSLRPYRGRVVVLELGVVGCSGTERAFRHMQELSKKHKDSVAFVRVDYGQKAEETREWYEKNPPGFDVFGDPSCAIGDSLKSQTMPTIYVYGKWGQLRYFGGLDPVEMEKMLQALLAETKPVDSNFFFKSGLKAGDQMPDFTLKTLSGGELKTSEYMKDAKAFVLMFAGTECPHSRAGTKAMAGILLELESEGLKVLVVNTGQAPDDIEGYYGSLEAGYEVLVDEDGAVAEKIGIDVVPSVYLSGPDGKILFNSRWNEEAIDQEIRILLGQLKPEDRKPVASEGTG